MLSPDILNCRPELWPQPHPFSSTPISTWLQSRRCDLMQTNLLPETQLFWPKQVLKCCDFMKTFRSVHRANADKLHLQLHQNKGSVWSDSRLIAKHLKSTLSDIYRIQKKITPTLPYLFSILVTLPIQFLPFQINLKAQLPVSKRV